MTLPFLTPPVSQFVAGNYFGEGTLGDVTITANPHYVGDPTEDGDPVILHYRNLTVQAGAKLMPQYRKKGLVIYVQENCTVNGEISMTFRGAAGTPTRDFTLYRKAANPVGVDSSGETPDPLFPDEKQSGGVGIYKIGTFVVGAAGGPKNGGNGAAAGAGQTGGGGAGDHGGDRNASPIHNGGNGGNGTAWSGGCGGSGGSGELGSTASDAPHNASEPPNNTDGTRGGWGAGNPNFATRYDNHYYNHQGTNVYEHEGGGTGGVLFLVVGGQLTIGSSGVLSANGHKGGYFFVVGSLGAGGGGGGGGGGAIFIAHRPGRYVNSGSLYATGGDRGNGAWGYNGGLGGNGSINLFEVQ